MSFTRDYLRMNLRLLVYCYRALLYRTDKHIFAFLFNLQSILCLSTSRCKWNGDFFTVSDKTIPGLVYRARHQEHFNYAYQLGVRPRARSLGDTYFLEKIGFKNGDTIIDCGANVGDLKLWFDLNNLQVRYVGFEPSPVEFECLESNVSPSEVHNICLWKESGEMDFFVSSQGADSSIIEPKRWEKKITVKVARLDEYIRGRVRCLKLEAEGAEPEILEGLGDKLKLIDYITADLGFERGVSEESTLAPVTNYLLARGFELVDVSHHRVCALYKNTNMEMSRGGSA